MRRFYLVPPFVCIPHIMTPLASSDGGHFSIAVTFEYQYAGGFLGAAREMEREGTFLGEASEAIFGRCMGAARDGARRCFLWRSQFFYFGPFLVFRALLLWPYALPPIVFYRVPPFVCIPHSMTPLASSHARTKCARPSKQWVWARDVFNLGRF